jgi:hypothetical protein
MQRKTQVETSSSALGPHPATRRPSLTRKRPLVQSQYRPQSYTRSAACFWRREIISQQGRWPSCILNAWPPGGASGLVRPVKRHFEVAKRRMALLFHGRGHRFSPSTAHGSTGPNAETAETQQSGRGTTGQLGGATAVERTRPRPRGSPNPRCTRMVVTGATLVPRRLQHARFHTAPQLARATSRANRGVVKPPARVALVSSRPESPEPRRPPPACAQ